MTTIALTTCADLPSLVDDDASFVAALRDRGVTADPVVWSDDSVDWNDYDIVVVRSIWDYYKRPDEFTDWLDALDAADCTVWNHTRILRWNGHKFYLRDLEAQGVSTLPTEYVECGGECDLQALFDERDWDELIVKPAVSAGAFETKRIARADAEREQSWVDDIVARKDVLVQEFAPDIADGEWSIVFFGDEFSHSVVKRPETGDFRVQEKHGGSVHVEPPSGGLLEQAADVVDAVGAELGEEPLYARVDGVERDGDFYLLEVELIEPELFFRVDSDAGDRLAEQILERV
ncbi:RimK family alpha-L-glutamate ligase [Haloferax sp. S1W]|uniref:RimK family alpha-L-glutamate ligase n=1 Tax=Haloferax sp. S1W TaxID=3377110 RepID=UPI0037C682B6